MKKQLFLIFIASVLGVTSSLAHAQYPDKPIRLVVPFGPGGNIDSTARIIAKGLSEHLGQAVVVENKSGASGLVGAQDVARANPNGYTALLASSGSLSAMKAVNPKLPIDPIKSFESAGSITRTSMVLVVNPTLPVTTLMEFIDYAKANPGKITMGSAGTGTSNHLAGELFQGMSDTKFLHVPYKGSSQVLADLLGGQIDITFDQISSALPHIKSGKVRALGITNDTRSDIVPDLPTLSESGLSGYESSTTTGIMFPAGTPKAIIETFHKALTLALQDEDVRKNFMSLGAEIRPGTPQDFADVLMKETDKWSTVAQQTNIQTNE